MIHKAAFLLLAAFLIFIPGASGAADIKEERDLRPAVLRADYNKLESYGLYTNPRDGSLGRDLWDNSRRSVLTELIPDLPLPGKSPTHQQLVMGALLTAANAGLIEDDIEIEPGKDLLTLRLEKLNSMGAYKQSFQIYSSLGTEPYHINLAKAGMTAMLFSGERSLACLEYKTMEDRAFDSDFWNEIRRYCRYVLAGENKDDLKAARDAMGESSLPVLRNIAKNGNYKISYNTANFKKISELEKAILVAEDRVEWPTISTDFLKKIPFSHLGIFMARDDLDHSEKFLVLLRATARGLANPSVLGQFYDEIFDAELRQRESADGLGWQKIAYAYHHAQKARQDEEKWNHILSTFPMIETYGTVALSPFAPLMQTIDIAGKNDGVIKNSLRIINYAGENIPGRWVKAFSEKKITSNFDRSMYLMSKIWEEKNAAEILEDVEIQAFLDTHKQKLKFNYFNIIENLDKHEKNIHNADKIYGNGFDLTYTENYVMPMPRVWDRLVNSSQNKRIGEAVLLSTAILRKQTLGEHYPGVVRDVLHSFNNVGLTKTSKALVLELVLEQQ